MTFPLKQQVQIPAGLDFPQTQMARFLAVNNIPFVDLLPVFRQRLQEGLLLDVLYIDDEHPAAPGHNAAAAALQQRMIKEVDLFLPRQIEPTPMGPPLPSISQEEKARE